MVIPEKFKKRGVLAIKLKKAPAKFFIIIFFRLVFSPGNDGGGAYYTAWRERFTARSNGGYTYLKRLEAGLIRSGYGDAGGPKIVGRWLSCEKVVSFGCKEKQFKEGCLLAPLSKYLDGQGQTNKPHTQHIHHPN